MAGALAFFPQNVQDKGFTCESSFYQSQDSLLSRWPSRAERRDIAFELLMPVDEETNMRRRTSPHGRGGDYFRAFQMEPSCNSSAITDLYKNFGRLVLEDNGWKPLPRHSTVPESSNIPFPKFAKPVSPVACSQDQSRAQPRLREDALEFQDMPGAVIKVDVAIQIGQEAQSSAPYSSTSTLDHKLENDSGLLGDNLGPPSVGSIGHPISCAEACKYFRKARSCKQGKYCTRCHLCERRHLGRWRRPRPQLANDFGESLNDELSSDQSWKDVSVDTQELEVQGLPFTDSAKSIGSIGHPFQCGPPCRYTWRKQGCKNGISCLCCHLCTWSRMS